MKTSIAILFLLVAVTLISHYVFDSYLSTFICAAGALVLLSKFMGDATEHLAYHVGQRYAGLVNVTLGNLAELIIIFAAVRAEMIDLAKAGIVGSVVGNILLVMGVSIIVGCRQNRVLKLNAETVTLYVNQMFLVGATLVLPSMFSGIVPAERQLSQSYVLAAMLAGAYLYYSAIFRHDERTKPVHDQARDKVRNGWTLSKSIVVLIITSIAAFIMSELLVNRTEQVAVSYGLSNAMLGFMLLPLLGNVAEHYVAVTAAWKGMAELSLAIAVGSASQVGMVVAPAAVLFGFMHASPVTLDFSGLPFQLLLISFVAAFIVLRDNKWRLSEGVMLIACYIAMLVCFSFAR